jgi:hypothetical protein
MKKILFFSRDYQADFFPLLDSENYESFHVTLTINEKKKVEEAGKKVSGCFELEYDQLKPANVPNVYFHTSLNADRYLGHLDYRDRLEVLGKEIQFWANLLDEIKPDLIINESIAIEIAEVLYVEALKRNIEYLSWMSFPVSDTFYWQTSPVHNSLFKEIFDREPGPSDMERANTYVKKVFDGAGAPFYAVNTRSRHNLPAFLKNVKSFFSTRFKTRGYQRNKRIAIFGAPSAIYKSAIISYFNSFLYKYDDLASLENVQLVFYPLHYEPEASLKYMSEFYDNQVGTIENMAKCLRMNQVLIVKEHPQQPGMLLTGKYRHLRANNSNVIYLPAEHPTANLIKKCFAVITLISTAGFEALIMGKPVFVLGKVFYDKCPGINYIESFSQLRELLHNDSYAIPDNNEVVHFLAQMINYTCSGNPFPHDNLYSKENANKIIVAIEEYLSSKNK